MSAARLVGNLAYADLGDRTQPGLVVRFDPGFGLNVYIEMLVRPNPWEPTMVAQSLGMSIQGWEHLCELVDEYRNRGTQ
jgi:hypothetical protein